MGSASIRTLFKQKLTKQLKVGQNFNTVYGEYTITNKVNAASKSEQKCCTFENIVVYNRNVRN